MKINDIKLTVDKPTQVKLLLLQDQDVKKEMSIGRIVEGKVRDSNIEPSWLSDSIAVIRDIWLTPDFGLYVSFSEHVEAFVVDKTDGIEMRSHDADGLLISQQITYWSVG